eukprot:6479259-Amphidinium_carterae.4
MEVVPRQALCDALPQGSKMLMRGIVNSDKMLLDVMCKHLPSDSFVKLGDIDNVESRLTKPRTIAECSNKLRAYLQDLRIADGILRSLGSSGPKTSVHLNSIKIVLLGDISESMDIDQLTSWAIHVLGLLAERVQHDKNMNQMFGSSPSYPRNAKDPQANAATPNRRVEEG